MNSETVRSRPPAVLWPIAIGLGLLIGVSSYRSSPDGLSFSAVVYAAEEGLLWVVLLWSAFRVTDRHPVGMDGGGIGILAHLAVVVGLDLSHLALTGLFDLFTTWSGGSVPVDRSPRLVHALSLAVAYTFFAGIAHLLEYARRSHEREVQSIRLEADLARSEARETRESLRALRLELNPQFLLNGLEGAEALAEDDPDGARRILVRLGDLLRRALLDREGREIHLDDELTLLDEFVALERDRRSAPLAVEHDVEDGALDALVPEMILQPILEQALARAPAGPGSGPIVVGAKRAQEALHLVVASATFAEREAIERSDGFRNVRERLSRYYGDDAAIAVSPRPVGAAVELRIPWREEPSGTPGPAPSPEPARVHPALEQTAFTGGPWAHSAGRGEGLEARVWRRAAWIAAGVWWAAVALVSASGWRTRTLVAGGQIPPGTAALAGTYVGLVLTVFAAVVFRAARRFPITRDRPVNLAAHVVIAPMLAVTTFLANLGPLLFVRYVRTSTLLESGAAAVRGFLVLYFIVLTIAQAVAYARRYRDRELRGALLEADLARSELGEARAALRVLRLELKPHFLLNGLNGVVALLADDPAGARRMLVRLRDLLRKTQREAASIGVPLDDELELLREFLAVQEDRFPEPLVVEWRIQNDVRHAYVPEMILQPLVENAIKHGLLPTGRGGRIVVGGARVGDRLELRVEDDGVGPGRSASAGTGVGVRNVRERLKRYFGGDATLTLEQVTGGGTCARVSVPWRNLSSAPDLGPAFPETAGP